MGKRYKGGAGERGALPLGGTHTGSWVAGKLFKGVKQLRGQGRSKLPANYGQIAGGIAFTAIIAVLGIHGAKLPGLSRVGPMVLSILIAALYRGVAGYPIRLKPGIQFSSKTLLRLAIVLFGFRLNLVTVLNEGLGLLVRAVFVVTGTITLVALVGRRLEADESLALLAGVGTGVCGAAAIAAVSPILDSKEEDTALGVGMIALTGTVFTLVYSLLRPHLPLSDLQYGAWAGLSLHEIAHVAAASSPAGPDALAIALLAKLGRVLLLIPLCFTLMYRSKKNGGQSRTRIEFPWFLAGFVVCSVLGSYLNVEASLLTGLTNMGSYMLTAAMAGLGLNVSLKALTGERVGRPFLAMLISSVVLSLTVFLAVSRL